VTFESLEHDDDDQPMTRAGKIRLALLALWLVLVVVVGVAVRS
jgi:hypothetical protein